MNLEERVQELLRKIPELDLERQANKSADEIKERAAAIRAETKTDGGAFIRRLMKERSDLAGLPFLLSSDCTLSSDRARTLALHSLRIRGQLGRAMRLAGTDYSRQGFYESVSSDPVAERFWSSAERTAWLFPEGIPTLQQILLAENRSFRLHLVRRLDGVNHVNASAVLVNRAVFDPDDEVRAQALRILKYRPKEEYYSELLKALRYPWEPAVAHAAEAIAVLGLRELVPSLTAMLNAPDPDRPFEVTGENGTKQYFVRELVRINHHRNCLLCHAPAGEVSRAELTQIPVGPVPSPERELPPTTSSVYYSARGGATLVRADVTYLRQDFSMRQVVDKPGKWPKLQRFDFLIRTRELTEVEMRKHPAAPPASAYKEAVLFALRTLTGTETLVPTSPRVPELSWAKTGDMSVVEPRSVIGR
jgi:hypothetical protein